MKQSFTILLLIISFDCLSQDRLAIINDPDGYVNIRSGETVDSAVIGKIVADDLFLYSETNTEWWKIEKPTYYKRLQGFVHKSRIKAISTLSKQEQRKLIETIFAKELEYIKTENWEERKNHHEPKFDLILNYASTFIIENNDVGLLQLFILTVKLDIGSADEMPSWTLGSIFLEDPDLVIEQFKIIGSTNDLVERLEFGFDNIVEGKESSILNYKELKVKIESLKYQ
jgi:hypothetical protein